MTFFESLIALLIVAVALLQIARHTRLPYPTLLAGAGVAVAAIPGTPSIPIDPETALALFIAPAIVDAAFDYPLGAARKLLAPLIVYAVGAVLLTAAVVAGIGEALLGLPLAAAIALGAIVAPPDAAAATAVLSGLPVARRVDAVLKGETLFNDATALLLFSTAVTVHERGGLDGFTAGLLALSVPGGILLGVAVGLLMRRVTPLLGTSVGATLAQFLVAFGVWVVAEHLHLSAVLATVAMAMTVSTDAATRDPPRMRVHSFAVWTTMVFVLNVTAFLLMGMQVRVIVAGMTPAQLVQSCWFAAAVVAGVVAARMVVAFGYRLYLHHRARGSGDGSAAGPKITVAETFLLGWTGMRGLLTLAAAFALPADMPQRGTLVLAAFAVVLVTLVAQGATLAPLIRWTGIGRADEAKDELAHGRAEMAQAAIARLAHEDDEEAAALRHGWGTHAPDADQDRIAHRRGLALAAILAARERLEELRAGHQVGADAYLQLQEQLDFKQLAVSTDDDRRLEEI